jgi:hypothetical protein
MLLVMPIREIFQFHGISMKILDGKQSFQAEGIHLQCTGIADFGSQPLWRLQLLRKKKRKDLNLMKDYPL